MDSRTRSVLWAVSLMLVFTMWTGATFLYGVWTGGAEQKEFYAHRLDFCEHTKDKFAEDYLAASDTYIQGLERVDRDMVALRTDVKDVREWVADVQIGSDAAQRAVGIVPRVPVTQLEDENARLAQNVQGLKAALRQCVNEPTLQFPLYFPGPILGEPLSTTR